MMTRKAKAAQEAANTGPEEAHATEDAPILPIRADAAIPANAVSAPDAEIVDMDNAPNDIVPNIQGTANRGRGG